MLHPVSYTHLDVYKRQGFMRTGLSKKQKTTSVFFDEASPIIDVCTYNTSLKKRLSEYAGKYPDECRLVDDDEDVYKRQA